MRFVLQRIGSDQIRQEKVERYVRRKKYVESLEAAAGVQGEEDKGDTFDTVERRKSIVPGMPGAFYPVLKPDNTERTEEAGVRFIKTIKQD